MSKRDDVGAVHCVNGKSYTGAPMSVIAVIMVPAGGKWGQKYSASKNTGDVCSREYLISLGQNDQTFQ